MGLPEEEQQAANERLWNVLLALGITFCLGYAVLIVRNLLLGVIASCLLLVTYIMYRRLQLERRRETRAVGSTGTPEDQEYPE